MQAPNCRNCQQSVAPDYAYCPHCGQTMQVHRISAHHLIHEGFHFFTHADKGVLQLLKAMVLYPGKLIRDYIEGRRKTIFSPINFFLIVAGILVISSTAFQPSGINSRAEAMRRAANHMKIPQAKERMLKTADRVETSMKISSKYANLISMLATPLMTFFLWLFYFRNKYNYTEHLVANMYIVGFTLLIFALVFTPLNALTGHRMGYYGLLAWFLFEIAYRNYAYYQFIQDDSMRGKIKAFGSSLFVVVFWAALSFFLVTNYIRNGLWGLFD